MDTQTPPGAAGPDETTAPADAGEGPAAAVLAAAARVEAADGRAPADMADADLLDALAAVPAAERALDRAVLVLLGAARAHRLPWSRIGEALDLSPDGARDRFDRAGRRHPDYTAPLPLALSAHRTRAWEMLLALDEPPGPGTTALAAERLGALLLTAALHGAPEAPARWLGEDTLHAAARAARAHPGGADAARVLDEHAADRPGTRADLVDIMREALHGSPRPFTPAPAAPDPFGRLTPGAPAPREGAPAPADAAELAAAAGLPPAAAAPLRTLHRALAAVLEQAPDLAHLAHRPAGALLRTLVLAVDNHDPAALARTVGALADLQGADLFDAQTLHGVSEPLGGLMLAVQGADHHGPDSPDYPLAGVVAQARARAAVQGIAWRDALYELEDEGRVPVATDSWDITARVRILPGARVSTGPENSAPDPRTLAPGTVRTMHQGGPADRAALPLGWDTTRDLGTASSVDAEHVQVLEVLEARVDLADPDQDAAVLLEGAGLGVLNVAADHHGDDVAASPCPPKILEKLQRAGFVSERGRITERGHAARKTANRNQ